MPQGQKPAADNLVTPQCRTSHGIDDPQLNDVGHMNYLARKLTNIILYRILLLILSHILITIWSCVRPDTNYKLQFLARVTHHILKEKY
jgi:hypothetical protein